MQCNSEQGAKFGKCLEHELHATSRPAYAHSPAFPRLQNLVPTPDSRRLAKYGMCLTKLGIYSSCSADILAMASAPSGVKWQLKGTSGCWLRIKSVSNSSVATAKLYQCDRPLKRAEGTIALRPLRRHSVMMAAPGPGGGVLDRPAVLPGYDNK